MEDIIITKTDIPFICHNCVVAATCKPYFPNDECLKSMGMWAKSAYFQYLVPTLRKYNSVKMLKIEYIEDKYDGYWSYENFHKVILVHALLEDNRILTTKYHDFSLHMHFDADSLKEYVLKLANELEKRCIIHDNISDYEAYIAKEYTNEGRKSIQNLHRQRI